MSTDRVTLQVTARTPEQLGSRNVRRLRKQGLIPGVLYGKATGSYAFAVGERERRTALSGSSGIHTVMDVELDGTSHTALVKDFQRHAIRGTVTHIDLHEVRLDQAIQATVALVLIGEAPGARQGGLVLQVARDVRIEALPTAIPDHVEVPIDELELGETVRLADATAREGVTLLDDLDTIVASCMVARVELEEEEEPAAEGEEPDSDADSDDAPSEE